MSVVDWLVQPYFTFLPRENAALLAGIVWGRKEFLTGYYTDLFRQTGLLHLLVLSGENITLLLTFFDFIPRVFGYKVRLAIVFTVGMFYLFTFSQEPSIVRAAIMAMITSCVLFFERQTLALYVFLCTCALMLIVQPLWLGSLSFWLSCSATFGIILVYPLLKNKNHLLDQIAVFIAAQLFTAPFILIFFRQYPVLSLFTNMAVMWLIEPLMFFGILLSFLGNMHHVFGVAIGFLVNGIIGAFVYIVTIAYRMSSLFIFKI